MKSRFAWLGAPDILTERFWRTLENRRVHLSLNYFHTAWFLPIIDTQAVPVDGDAVAKQAVSETDVLVAEAQAGEMAATICTDSERKFALHSQAKWPKR